MPRTRHSVWDFDPDRQDLGFMVGYAARDLWSCIREEHWGRTTILYCAGMSYAEKGPEKGP